jgi:hypothetical protein
VMDRAFDSETSGAQFVREYREVGAIHAHGEMDMRAGLIAELPLAGEPEAEPGPLACLQPDEPLLRLPPDDREAEIFRIPPFGGIEVRDLQGEFRDARDFHHHPARRFLLLARSPAATEGTQRNQQEAYRI